MTVIQITLGILGVAASWLIPYFYQKYKYAKKHRFRMSRQKWTRNNIYAFQIHGSEEFKGMKKSTKKMDKFDVLFYRQRNGKINNISVLGTWQKQHFDRMAGMSFVDSFWYCRRLMKRHKKHFKFLYSLLESPIKL